jgi:hypothetical protein
MRWRELKSRPASPYGGILTFSRFFLRPECQFFGFVGSLREEQNHEEEQVYRGADFLRPEAGGDGDVGGEVIRRMGISEQTFYRWKKLYDGLDTGELRRLK